MSMSDMTTATKNTRTDRASRPGRAPQDRRKPREVARLDEAAAIAQLVRDARAEGEDLVGPGGLLKRITKMVLETALEEEMTDHLGHGKHQLPHGAQGPKKPAGRPVRTPGWARTARSSRGRGTCATGPGRRRC